MSITTKDELAKQVAARTGLEQRQAKAAVEATIEEITAQLAAGNEVKFTGFGKFSTVARPAREGRNPRTGESMQIAAKTAAKFSPRLGDRGRRPSAHRLDAVGVGAEDELEAGSELRRNVARTDVGADHQRGAGVAQAVGAEVVDPGLGIGIPLL